MNRNAYEVLDISPIASDEEIRKQYHTLIRRVHNDKTSLEEMTTGEREKCEAQVREYNDAYDKLKKGRRATYDASLGLNKKHEEFTIYSKPITLRTKSYVDFSEEYEDKVKRKKQNLGPEFDAFIEQLFNNLFTTRVSDFKGFSFQGSYTVDPSQKLQQEYWKLVSEKRKLEQDLKDAERDAKIAFYRKEPNIEYQIESERRNNFAELSSIELNKNTRLSEIEQDYLYKVSGRFVTNKKREKAKQALEKAQEKIMNEYNAAKKALEDKQRKLQSQKEAYEKSKEEFIKSDPKVQFFQKKNIRNWLRMDTIHEQLENQKAKTFSNKVTI